MERSSPSVPDAKDIEVALATFARQGAMCYARGTITNSGFAASISFNSCQHRSDAGSLEIAWRTVALRFATKPGDACWTWSDGAVQMVRAHESTIQARIGAGDRLTNAFTMTDGTERSAQISFAALLAGAFSGKTSVAIGRNDGRERTTSRDLTISETTSDVELQRRDACTFELRLNAAGHGDLVRFNPSLARLSVLDHPEPSSARPQDVTITAVIPSVGDGGAVHALRVRAASGAWACLADTPNRRFVSEILISKFLAPLHEPAEVWPIETGDAQD